MGLVSSTERDAYTTCYHELVSTAELVNQLCEEVTERHAKLGAATDVETNLRVRNARTAYTETEVLDFSFGRCNAKAADSVEFLTIILAEQVVNIRVERPQGHFDTELFIRKEERQVCSTTDVVSDLVSTISLNTKLADIRTKDEATAYL